MLGVIRLTFEDDDESMSDDDDFFSVASTIPLVAVRSISDHVWGPYTSRLTFDTQRCDALVDCVKSILCTHIRPVFTS